VLPRPVRLIALEPDAHRGLVRGRAWAQPTLRRRFRAPPPRVTASARWRSRPLGQLRVSVGPRCLGRL